MAVTALLGKGVCALVGGEALRVRFNEAPLPLSACSVPKEMSAEAREARMVTANVCTTSQASKILFRSSPCCIPFSVVFVPDLV